VKVQIYSKPDCGLCDEAKGVISQARAVVPFELVETNIEADPALFAEYRYDIPVVFIDGHKAFKHHVTLPALLARLRRT
jgi:hypothetical protein